MSNKEGRGSLFIIAAPSGGGKTSLVNALLRQDPRLTISVSHTTRAPRPGEIDGEHYHFVSKDDYQKMVENGEFMEHAVVFDHLYGTSQRSVTSQLKLDRDVILEIDWQGARQIKSVFPACCGIFIIPPSLETLRKRLTGRGQDSQKTIQRRMRDARAEISHWNEFDFLVVNDNFDAALQELIMIIDDFRVGRSHAKNKIYQILAEQLGKS